jgi:hypothetical protein
MKSRPEEPHLIVRVAGTDLALPISCVARLEERGAQAAMDLGALCELDPAVGERGERLALRTAAGVVVARLDAIEELIQQPHMLELPALTALTQPEVVRGLLAFERAGERRLAAVLDGARLADLVAERLYQQGDRAPATTEPA